MSSGVYDHLVADYLCTLESGFRLETPGEEGWLITPFERPDGDYIELQLTSEDDGSVTISDGGDTTNFLFASGLDVDSQALRDSLSSISSPMAWTLPKTKYACRSRKTGWEKDCIVY